MTNKTIAVTFSRSDNLEDIVAKIEFATDISDKARLAYNIIKKHPGMVSFHTDYIMKEDGSVELVGVCMDVSRPNIEKPEQNRTLFE